MSTTLIGIVFVLLYLYFNVTEIKNTPSLIGSLSEVYYKEYCEQHGWAYISLEQIHDNGIREIQRVRR